MSLNWTIEKIENWKEVCWLKDESKPDGAVLNPVTQALTFATIAVGLTEISAANLDEWKWRLSFLRAVGKGDFLVMPKKRGKGFEERGFYAEELEAHIGLGTNAGNTDRAAWVKRVVELLKCDATRNARDFFPSQKAKH